MTPEELQKCAHIAADGVVVACRVHPGAKCTRAEGLYGGEMKISLKAPPVDGKANKELCKFFASACEIPNSSAELVSGQTSRSKKILLHGVAMETFLKAFSDGN